MDNFYTKDKKIIYKNIILSAVLPENKDFKEIKSNKNLNLDIIKTISDKNSIEKCLIIIGWINFSDFHLPNFLKIINDEFKKISYVEEKF